MFHFSLFNSLQPHRIRNDCFLSLPQPEPGHRSSPGKNSGNNGTRSNSQQHNCASHIHRLTRQSATCRSGRTDQPNADRQSTISILAQFIHRSDMRCNSIRDILIECIAKRGISLSLSAQSSRQSNCESNRTDSNLHPVRTLLVHRLCRMRRHSISQRTTRSCPKSFNTRRIVEYPSDAFALSRCDN